MPGASAATLDLDTRWSGVRALFLVATACLAGPALAGTFFIAPPPAGDDGNPGSLAQPWATLAHAADTVQAGDTVLVRAGDYAGAEFTTTGTEQAPIVLAAYPGETPRIVSDISARQLWRGTYNMGTFNAELAGMVNGQPASIHADARGELFLTTTGGAVFQIEANP